MLFNHDKSEEFQTLIDPQGAVFLMLDHQAGLFQVVKDISVEELRTNATVLAKIAALLKIPVITSASEPNGPNGPLMPEIQQAAPHAVFVPRKGEVNAWETNFSSTPSRKPAKRL